MSDADYLHVNIGMEIEACAKLCESIAEDRWALFKGLPPYTGHESGRGSDYVQGESDAAIKCADAIRGRIHKWMR